MKKLLVLALLILNVFVCASFAQTKKTSVRRKSSIVRKRPVSKAVSSPTILTSAATTTATGLTFIITDRGTGAQFKAGDTVTVHYTGLLTNGVKFDSSLDRNEPFSFPLGAGRVIKGWDEGIQKLRVGDKATFIIPPQLGYGARGGGDVIPPNATLIFIVEAVGVQ